MCEATSSGDKGSSPASKEDGGARKLIDQLTKTKGNNICADCGEKNPQWASVNFGVFICINCAGIHRSLTGLSASKVRSVRLDSWTPEMVKSLVEVGNSKAKERYEAKVPPCWLPPKPDSRQICLEQWIRAKYERMEFIEEIEEVKRPYITGTRQGPLIKRKKDADEWKSRWFVLSHDYLSYYLCYQDRAPKAAIPLSHLNVTLQVPGLEERNNMMLIAFYDHKTRKTRNIFVYSESGKEIMNWFCAIRMAKIRLLQETFPERPLEIIRQKASRDFLCHGYLEKTPPLQSKWQKRFFVLDQNSLRYYNRPTDPLTTGEIILGSGNDGYSVSEDVPAKLTSGMYSFMLHDPNRANGGYPLMAESEDSKQQWMACLKYAIAETTGTPDQSVAPATYEDDDDIYATIEELK